MEPIPADHSGGAGNTNINNKKRKHDNLMSALTTTSSHNTDITAASNTVISNVEGHNGKVKHRDSVSNNKSCFFDYDDPIDMMVKLVHSFSREIQVDQSAFAETNNGSNATSGVKDSAKKQIVKLQDQLDSLNKAQQCMEQFIANAFTKLKRQKQQEISDLYDTYSPLLSLGRPLLSTIMSFCDPSALCCCEEASYTLGDVIEEHKHWQTMYDVVKTKTELCELDGSVIPEPARNRAISRFKTLDDATTRRISTFDADIVRGQLCRWLGMLSTSAAIFESFNERQLSLCEFNVNDPTPMISFRECYQWQNKASGNHVLARISVWDEVAQIHRVVHQNFTKIDQLYSGDHSYLYQISVQTSAIEFPELQDFYDWKNKNNKTSIHDPIYREERRRLQKALARVLRVTIITGNNRFIAAADECYSETLTQKHYNSCYGVCYVPVNNGQAMICFYGRTVCFYFS